MKVVGQLVLLAVFFAFGWFAAKYTQPKPPVCGILALAETSAHPPGVIVLPEHTLPPRNKGEHWDYIRECPQPRLDIPELFIHGLDSEGRPVVRATHKVATAPKSSHQFHASIPPEPQGEMKDHYEISLSYYKPEEWRDVHSISALYVISCGVEEEEEAQEGREAS